ncbi:hypothetical protein BCS96_13685 [Vibrio breoganii]|uniref:hypothetical protein n=1 Tax=Vibrio breoganii TaxID=553239 RepID=UPI000C85D5C4|nr:hypothetical protein [Vibrio breoganii]PMF98867.1 hypothetical protein BCV02_16635 [Vibrio breoganii]PMG32329.1 hypothetical protein BCU93_00755 [Vibrio breoganii]PMG82407.1 hypothetical protein BCU81_03120 [Vibrio breoganii]PMG92145.1 hypothetical protein BCU80_11385 [Vibrio breoganii]PMK29405.1 hypothetical protein BCU03_11265 [Vibrio breoganii]
MAQSNRFTLTLLVNADLGQLINAPKQLVQIDQPVCDALTPQTILTRSAIGITSAQCNKLLTAINLNAMTIEINNNGFSECWRCSALLSSEDGQTGAVLELLETKRAPGRKAQQ